MDGLKRLLAVLFFPILLCAQFTPPPGGGGGAPTGAAGGLLSGTYPNPGLGKSDCPVTFSGPAATTTATWPAAAGCTSISYAPPNGTTAVTINSPAAGPVLTGSAPTLYINFTQPASGGTLTSVTAPSEFVNTPFNSNTIPQEAGTTLNFQVQLVGSNLVGQSAINNTGHGISSTTTAPASNPQSGQTYPWFSTADGGNAEWLGPTGSLFKGFLSGADCNPVTGLCTKTGGVSFAASATTDTTSATNITSGTLPSARIVALPHANIAATAVTPGAYTNANITVAADGSVTAAANGTGGAGGGSALNPSCTFATSATGCTISVAGLTVLNANTSSIVTQCWTGASAVQTAVAITTYTYALGATYISTVAPAFLAAAAGGYCAANLTSGGVNTFSGDTALLNNSNSTGTVTATLTNAGSQKVWGNPTASTAAPSYHLFTDFSQFTAPGFMPNATMIPLVVLNGANGVNSDFTNGYTGAAYTVPANRQLLIFSVQNNGANNCTLKTKLSGVYTTFIYMSNNTGTGISATFATTGQGVAANCTGTTTLTATAYEMDQTSPLVTAAVISDNAGAGAAETLLLYTVPIGKHATILSTQSAGYGSSSGGAFFCSNTTGGSINYTPYLVASGDAPAAKYQATALYAIANGANLARGMAATLSGGDTIQVLLSASTLGSSCFVDLNVW